MESKAKLIADQSFQINAVQVAPVRRNGIACRRCRQLQCRKPMLAIYDFNALAACGGGGICVENDRSHWNWLGGYANMPSLRTCANRLRQWSPLLFVAPSIASLIVRHFECDPVPENVGSVPMNEFHLDNVSGRPRILHLRDREYNAKVKELFRLPRFFIPIIGSQLRAYGVRGLRRGADCRFFAELLRTQPRNAEE